MTGLRYHSFLTSTRSKMPEMCPRAWITTWWRSCATVTVNSTCIRWGSTGRAGSLVLDGWTQLIGAAYERRIYAFRFNTTPAQDDALIKWLNDRPNRSHFHMLFRNCADFARQALNVYFPHAFHRSIFPDAGVTTPKQILISWFATRASIPKPALPWWRFPRFPATGGTVARPRTLPNHFPPPSMPFRSRC